MRRLNDKGFRLLSFTCAIALLVMIMAACSGSGENGSDTKTPNDKKSNTNTEATNGNKGANGENADEPKVDLADVKGEVRVITPWGGGFGEQFTKMFEDFNKEYPNIKVTLLEQTTADLAALIAAGETPDIISVLYMASDLRKDNMIEDLRPYLDASPDVTPDLFYEPAYMRSVDENGAVWALPWHVDPNFALVYNNDILEQYGYTEIPEMHSLQEFGDFLHKFWVIENGEQVMTTFDPSGIYGPLNTLSTISYLNGADQKTFYNPAERKVMFNDPLIVEALQWIVDFKRENVDQERLGKLDSTLPENTGRFAAGKSLMQPDITPVLRGHLEQNPDVKFTPMPEESIWLGGWSFTLTTVGKKENKDAAWALLKWMTSTKAGAESQQKHFGWISGIKDNPYLESEAKKDPVSAVAFEVLKKAKKMPPNVPVDFEPEFNKKWDEVMAGTLEPKAFLDHITTYTQAMLDEQKP
ncbi:extracellular solute-binding protein [Paenibacillus spongiae]|uniref:Extracellular solute-binding protein n=1 Tax=Paenibacillus spongiae TaxID=2909671 RepID=A0ABY5SB74_9BACL|nr:extracellular solute-binding protein [Paenibacillus spongiae]UVI29548.1 extracellular solute-binding protein [Paenibacillus spongiae]